MMHCLVARDGVLSTGDLSQLGSYLADPRARVWVDMEDAGAEGFAQLAPALQFHPLTIEDCISQINYPKVEEYDGYLYLAVHSARWEESEPRPMLRELDIMIGPNYLVTYHEGPTRSVSQARATLERRCDPLMRGPDALLHTMLDVMVDNYLPILELLERRMDQLEVRVFRAPAPSVLSAILQLKRGLAMLRRIAGPQRDVILSLTRTEFRFVRPELRPYLRDVFDRMVRVGDMCDTYRDELALLLEIYTSQISNRLNEVMKVLTAFTVILIPVTLVTGLYGMNFEHMPELRWRYGYLWALGLMAAVGVGVYAWLRGRRWL